MAIFAATACACSSLLIRQTYSSSSDKYVRASTHTLIPESRLKSFSTRHRCRVFVARRNSSKPRCSALPYKAVLA